MSEYNANKWLTDYCNDDSIRRQQLGDGLLNERKPLKFNPLPLIEVEELANPDEVETWKLLHS